SDVCSSDLAYAFGPVSDSVQSSLFDAPAEQPELNRLKVGERFSWDLELTRMSSLKLHPVDLLRSQLRELGVTPLPLVKAGRVRTAGLVLGVQTPPTAKGAAFVMIEDGEQLAQLVVSKELWQEEYRTFRDSRLLLVEGKASRTGMVLSINVEAVHAVRSRETDAHEHANW